MRTTWAIAYREFRSYFISPSAYIILAAFISILSWMFFQILSYFVISQLQGGAMGQTAGFTEAVVAPLWGNMNIVLLFLIPGITMKLLAEEQYRQTIQLLYTAPVHIIEITLGKFLGGFLFVVIMIAITAFYPILMSLLATDGLIWEPIIGSYIGILFVGAAYISVGLFFSAITENQIIAFVLAFILNLGFYLIYWGGQTSSGITADILTYISIIDHFRSLSQGVLNSSDIVYFVTFIGFWIFATYSVLESKRWNAS